jgi:predicted transcriptional regulator
MNKKAIFLSVLPKFATKILSGAKTVELRKVRPNLTEGDLILLYVTSPEKSLQAILRVCKVRSGSPDELWENSSEGVGLSYTEYKTYFNGTKLGCAIYFDNVVPLPNPLSLSTLRTLFPGFQPPQVHRYISAHELDAIIDEVGSTFKSHLFFRNKRIHKIISGFTWPK